jgi:hypothetical protein
MYVSTSQHSSRTQQHNVVAPHRTDVEQILILGCLKPDCVDAQVIKFTYNLLPANSAFSVEYPEPRRLSPGMSATIKASYMLV